MPNWRTVDESDLAASVSQGEIDAYRADSPLDGSDPVARLLKSTVDAVRGYISCNGAVRMGPAGDLISSGSQVGTIFLPGTEVSGNDG